MPQFTYKALDKKGIETQGVVTADNYKEAIKLIKQRDLYPTEVNQSVYSSPSLAEKKEKPVSLFSRLMQPSVKTKHIAPFINDLATLLDAGLPLVRALDVMTNQTISPGLIKIVKSLSADVEGGQTFSDSLGRYPKYFPPLFINMVKAGEMGGVLGESLSRLARIYEKNARLESRMKAALMYPATVLFFASMVVVFIVAFVVPKFFTMFADMGSDIPAATQFLYDSSQFIQGYWPFFVVAIFGLIALVKFLYTVPKARFWFDKLKLALPVFGKLLKKVSISRFCRTFGTLLASGVPILQTLTVAKSAAGNVVYEQAIDRVKESLKEGESIAMQLTVKSLFPPLVTNMIMVGEETGTLSDMLMRVADRFDDDVDTMVAQLTSLIEPFLIVGLGMIVGFIVIALFLPLVSVVSNLTGA